MEPKKIKSKNLNKLFNQDIQLLAISMTYVTSSVVISATEDPKTLKQPEQAIKLEIKRNSIQKNQKKFTNTKNADIVTSSCNILKKEEMNTTQIQRLAKKKKMKGKQTQNSKIQKMNRTWKRIISKNQMFFREQ